MHKTTVVVDDRKIARARKALGTRGIRDTIDRALDEVIALRSRERFARDMASLRWYDRKVLRNVRQLAWK